MHRSIYVALAFAGFAIAGVFAVLSMKWSAEPTQTDKPFGSWADDLAAAFVPLEPRKMTDRPFQGTITRTETAPVRISRVIATSHRILRLRSHIARGKDDLCFINLQLEGVGRYTQRGHEQINGPADLAVVDTTEPFELTNAYDFKVLCFAVPRQLLPAGFCERPRLTLSATEAGRALSRTLAGYAELSLSFCGKNRPIQNFRSQAPSEIATLGTRHIVDLICHAPEVLAVGSSERANAPVLLSMMMDHIDRRSADPDLSAEALARRFHCSERYVHKLFAGTGRSVGEHVNDRRIVACTRDLLDNPRNRTVAEIAFAAGFRDISHFNRLFKRVNGTAPREFRRAMAASFSDSEQIAVA
jgi:AraC family transcriptional regulator, positive regulator of tynA and feaB